MVDIGPRKRSWSGANPVEDEDDNNMEQQQHAPSRETERLEIRSFFSIDSNISITCVIVPT